VLAMLDALEFRFEYCQQLRWSHLTSKKRHGPGRFRVNGLMVRNARKKCMAAG
jgi:hypothetical protein